MTGEPSARYVRSRAVLSREVETATLLLPAGGGPVLSLSGAGPVIWALLRTPMTFDDLVHALAERYHVGVQDIADDVRHTLSLLLEASLLRREAA